MFSVLGYLSHTATFDYSVNQFETVHYMNPCEVGLSSWYGASLGFRWRWYPERV